MVYRLDDDLWFPDPEGGTDGLIAVGGDLSPERLLLAYSHGIFPWYPFKKEDWGDNLAPGEEPRIQWYCPLDRFVIYTDKVHISHSMRNLINSGKYEVSFNQDFESVIRNCGALRKDEEGAWLGPEITAAYTELHKMGNAYSVEVWDQDQQLAGGLYGVMAGKIFCGESMFSLKPSASKLALIYLAMLLKENGVQMIDCQMETPHLKSMGGVHITYEEYMRNM
ncbi:MAG: leucyl/phenylalanyl-tRNA--protein transferase [Bacteroidales bacterium]|nr:leucyl/phenylalanyl-tRNA--protein transferase [Bacteroidales bacterium]